jgi:hypothetical protein
MNKRNQTPIDKKIPKLRKSTQPPLSHAGAVPDSDRARRPPLAGPLRHWRGTESRRSGYGLG